MKGLISVAILLALATTIAAQTIAVGVAIITATSFNPGLTGWVTFTSQSDSSVLMVVNVSGITQYPGNNHGIHVHQYGDLYDSAKGESAGSHWNILNQVHGCPGTDTRHIGDTGNWQVNADGTILANKTLDLMALTGTDSLIGLAVTIHNFTDDCAVTTSSGNRLGFGVIGVANPAYYNATANTAAPPSNYSSLNNAICILQNAAGSGISGWIRFEQISTTSVNVTAAITGLTLSSVHGFHIHQYGDLSKSDGSSAGSHFTGLTYNSAQLHGIPGSPFVGTQLHAGDMGNLYYYESGVAYYNNILTNFGLWGTANPILGRAVVVHNNFDDCSQPTGNAGSRLAFCVIGAANPAYGGNATLLAIPLDVPTTQNSTLCAVVTSGTTGTTTGTTGTTTGTTGSTTGTTGVAPTTTSTSTTKEASSAWVVIPSILLVLIAMVI